MKPILLKEAVFQILQRVIKKADELNININVAVVNDGGNLVGFLKMDGAPLMGGEIAINKAYTAVGFGIPTSEWYPKLVKNPPLQNGIVHTPRMVPFGGGVPIYLEGHLVGGVGVSGGTADQDEACALEGIEFLT